MLTRKRLYTKKEPDKEAKLFIIFCEGQKREAEYFNFFNGMASQVKIEAIPNTDGQGAPKKLYENADGILEKYDIGDQDEIWFVIDTDDWRKQITDIKNSCAKKTNWYVAQSNPSFEIWLYYHFYDVKPAKEIVEEMKGLKPFVASKIKGGFDNRKHPIHIQTAVTNAHLNFKQKKDELDLFTTEVHVLASKMLPLIKDELDMIITRILRGC